SWRNSAASSAAPMISASPSQASSSLSSTALASKDASRNRRSASPLSTATASEKVQPSKGGVSSSPSPANISATEITSRMPAALARAFQCQKLSPASTLPAASNSLTSGGAPNRASTASDRDAPARLA